MLLSEEIKKKICDVAFKEDKEILDFLRDYCERVWGTPKGILMLVEAENKRRKRMKPKLKIRIEKWEKALMCQILEMDERFRRSKWENESYNSDVHNLKIISNTGPKFLVGGEAIFLRGKDVTLDNEPFYRTFNTNKERDEYYDKLDKVLLDWAKHWEGFQEKEDNSEIEEGNIHIY